MGIANVNLTDTFDQWRLKTNQIILYSNQLNLQQNLVFDTTNSAYTVLNAAYTSLNAAYVVANSAYNNANIGLSSANAYANLVGASGNAYINVSTTASNNYADFIGLSGNTYANVVGASSNAYANLVGISGNTYANLVSDSSNAYANVVGLSGNVYVNVTATSVNAYANLVGASSNAYANVVGISGNVYVNVTATSVNAYANLVGASSNAYVNVSTTSSNNYAGFMANSANASAISYTMAVDTKAQSAFALANNNNGAITLLLGNSTATIIVAQANYNLTNAAFDFANTTANNLANTAIAANNRAGLMANSSNGYAVTVGASGNNYAGVMANSANNYAGAMANAANGYATSTYLAKTGGTISNDLVVSGNLTVSGTTTYVNTAQLQVGDNIIVLNADIPNTVYSTENAGIEINRGKSNSNAAITWIEGVNAWAFTSNTLNAYTTYIASNTDLISANNYAGVMANSSNGYAVTVGASGNNYAGLMANSANGYAVTVGNSSNNYSGLMANSSNGYAVTVGASGNNYAGLMANSSNGYAVTVGASGNNYAGVMANSANAYAATKVASVSGTTGQISSSGGTTPALSLITTGVTASTYGGSTQIPVVAVDSYGRITSASTVAVQGMDYVFANTKVFNVTSNSTSRIWANTTSDSSGLKNVYVDLATSGVTALNYGGSTQIPTFAVDSYGRITGAANVSIITGSTITNETASISTFYPVFTTTTTGTMSYANVSTSKLTFVPSTGILSSTGFNSLSDRLYKENIQPISNALDIVNSINGVRFNWKETGLPSFGVIAQDIEKSIPELIGEVNNSKTVNYDGIIAFLIEAIKTLDARVRELESK